MEQGGMIHVDPLAEDFASWSPYNYVLGNPISLVDPDGRAPDNIVVPDKKDQKRILTMINEKASSSFEFNEQNELQLCESSCNVEFGSNYYTEKLIEGINAKETITIEIGQTFSANGKTKDVDKDAGGGVTISKAQGVKKEAVDQLVIISGNENVNLKDTKGNPLTDTAADILLHELVGHAIPHIVGSDTGNAVENENKARAEMTQYQSGVKVPSPLRAAEKRHKE